MSTADISTITVHVAMNGIKHKVSGLGPPAMRMDGSAFSGGSLRGRFKMSYGGFINYKKMDLNMQRASETES